MRSPHPSRVLPALALFAMIAARPVATFASDWPQFRGPHSAGLAAGNAPLPVRIGPNENVLWKTPLPPGHSSPVLVGDRIFLTAERDRTLLTIALDRASGKVLWEAEAPYTTLEEIHSIGSHVQPSPAADAEHVVTFFGSSGLFCYDHAGKLVWNKPFGPFKNTFGAGSSPILVGDRVILCQDHDTDSFLMALEKQTGKVLWKTDRSEFTRNYGTPVIWEVNGKSQIVVAATLRVVGYDLETGKELWTVRGVARFFSSTPVIGRDGLLYVAGWAAGGDEGERLAVEAWDQVIPRDANNNAQLEEDELPDGPIKMRFTQVDRDKSGAITEAEYSYFRKLFDLGRNVTLAIRPGGTGDITDTHVAWSYRKFVPFCASPVFVDGKLFTVKDGGILSCLNTLNGKPEKQGRLEATGDYYSSPVAGDGKVYLLSEEGKLTVVSADTQWDVLHTADFGENAYASPALVDGRIYLRTTGHLYCFGQKD